MKKTFVYVVLTTMVFFIIGYFSHSFLSKEFEAKITFYPLTSTIEGQTEFACDSIADAYLAKNWNENTVSVFAGKGTDKISLRINSVDQYVLLLTQAAVGAGATEGEKHQILEENDEYVVAIAQVSAIGPNYSLIMFNKKDHQVIWSKTGDTMFRSGSVMYLDCK